MTETNNIKPKNNQDYWTGLLAKALADGSRRQVEQIFNDFHAKHPRAVPGQLIGMSIKDHDSLNIPFLNLAICRGKADIIECTLKEVLREEARMAKTVTSKNHHSLKAISHARHPILNHQDSQGQTAVHIAVSCGDLKSLHLLVNNGASVLLKDSDGHTPADWVETMKLPPQIAKNMRRLLKVAATREKHRLPKSSERGYPNQQHCR